MNNPNKTFHPFAIFDMDGTLVDSMKYWQNLAVEYLKDQGISHVPSSILDRIRPMTMEESAALFIEEFGLPGTAEEIVGEMNQLMDTHYQFDIPLKNGVQDYLRKLQINGVRMCVASATAEPLMKTCLHRLGILEHFEFLLSCETMGVGKSKPDIYNAAAKKLGASPQETAVYEDALYAAKTAKNAGYYVIGIYDDSAASQWNEMLELADECILHWYRIGG